MLRRWHGNPVSVGKKIITSPFKITKTRVDRGTHSGKKARPKKRERESLPRSEDLEPERPRGDTPSHPNKSEGH